MNLVWHLVLKSSTKTVRNYFFKMLSSVQFQAKATSSRSNSSVQFAVPFSQTGIHANSALREVRRTQSVRAVEKTVDEA
jgi:hypothetical protein